MMLLQLHREALITNKLPATMIQDRLRILYWLEKGGFDRSVGSVEFLFCIQKLT